jgi:hypothetical protein
MAKPTFSKKALADFVAGDTQPAVAQTVAEAPSSPVVPLVAKSEPEVSAKAPEAVVEAPVESAPQSPVQPAAPVANRPSIEELQRQLEEAQRQIRENQVKSARYPWENPDRLDEQGRTGYNFKLDAALYLKIQWLMENKGGFKSIQVFLEKAGNAYADQLLAELKAN